VVARLAELGSRLLTVPARLHPRLDPDPAGLGTHRQLGLGGCAFLILSGMPCPMCGMTTTFALLADLSLRHGLWNQPFGGVLFAVTLAGATAGLVDLVSGRGLVRRLHAFILKNETRTALALLLGLLGGWAWKLMLFRGLLDRLP
jgi:lysylphosphatidylglycerol synthetase-like protein (DUF2156 family)